MRSAAELRVKMSCFARCAEVQTALLELADQNTCSELRWAASLLIGSYSFSIRVIGFASRVHKVAEPG